MYTARNGGKLIIAISGKSGAGKNSVGEEVARLLGYKVVSFSFKQEAQKAGFGLMEYQKLASKDKSIDTDLDRRIAAEASAGNCVVVTWLGPWVVKDADLRVWLEADDATRAMRIANRDKMGAKQALEHVKKRDADNRERYLKLYGIDIDDRSIFGLQLNSSVMTIGQMATTIVDAAESMEKRPGKHEAPANVK
ncbi:cytidylate kinase [Candidatus Parvarchaeota archaeon]|nr:cytidylate kinase [Candidatus Parvarchaeota archaeon]